MAVCSARALLFMWSRKALSIFPRNCRGCAMAICLRRNFPEARVQNPTRCRCAAGISIDPCQEHLMCGRAKLPDDVSEIKLDLKIDLDEIGDYRPRWNAAPTSKLPVVISDNARRILTLMRWGLVPSWADDLKIGYSTFNARVESLTTRAAFRGAWQAGRRCLVIADGYYEWRDSD